MTTAESLSLTTHHVEQPPPYVAHDTAFVTMASGERSTRFAVTLVQSLRDVATSHSHDIIVLVVRGGLPSNTCFNDTWRRTRGREHIACDGPHTIVEELLESAYIDTLTRLGAILRVINPIPITKYTSEIAGGHQAYWGMSLNRLVIFNMTEYKKIVWMDSDSIAVKNLDHLFGYPTFTSAITHGEPYKQHPLVTRC